MDSSKILSDTISPSVEDIDIDKISFVSRLCLICSSKDCCPQNKNGHYFNSPNGDNNTDISQQLNVIFLLKKLLQVPTVNLEKYLVKFGSPTNWQVSLCEQCTQLVNQAKDLHLLILENTAKLKRVQKVIVDKVKFQNNPSPSADNLVYQETQDFIKSHNYDDYFQEDPLLKGNQLLKKLLDELTLSTEVKIEIDVDEEKAHLESFQDQQLADADDDHDDDFSPDNSDVDWAPSPEPTRSPRKKLRRRESGTRSSSARIPKATTTNIPPPPCPQCSLKLSSVCSLFTHLRTAHATNILPCTHPGCTKLLKSRNKYYDHQKLHQNPPTCHLCPPDPPISFLSLKELRHHLNHQHDVLKLRHRSMSASKLQSEDNPDSHPDPTSGIPKFMPRRCHKCPLQFRLIKQLFHHVLKVHSTNQVPCFDPNCSKILTSRNEYIAHRNEHEKPFKCEKCGAAFISPATLRSHMADDNCDNYITKTKTKEKDSDAEEGPDATDKDNSDDDWATPSSKKPTRRSPRKRLQKVKSRTRTSSSARIRKATTRNVPSATPMPCPQCPLKMSGVCSLFTHLRTTHSTNILPCPHPQCTRTLRSISQYYAHEKFHKNPQTCHLCPPDPPTSFLSRKELRNHLKQQHDVLKKLKQEQDQIESPDNPNSHPDPTTQIPKYLPRGCHKCPLKFRFVNQLFRHVLEVHSTNQIPCSDPNCSKILTNRDDYLAHQNAHEKPFKCEKCDSTFINPANLRSHMTHKHLAKSDEIYSCDKCEFKASWATALFKHLEETHPDNIEIRCPFEATCEVILKKATQWSTHEMRHKYKLERVTCHFCGKMFMTRNNLKFHLARMHANEGKGEVRTLIRCKVKGCDGKYMSNESLESHMKRMHGLQGGGGGGTDGGGEEEKPVHVRHSCSFCGKGFYSMSRVKEHEKIHKNAETRPYVCEMCGKGFTTYNNLYGHKRYTHYKNSLKLLNLKKYKQQQQL